MTFLAASVAGGCNKLTLEVAGYPGDSVVVQKQCLEAWKLWEAFDSGDDIV